MATWQWLSKGTLFKYFKFHLDIVPLKICRQVDKDLYTQLITAISREISKTEEKTLSGRQ